MDALLLERDESIATLDHLIAGLGEGAGRVALVGGEAGVGKTSLIEHVADRHRSSANVLWGACDALSTPRTLGPLYDIAPQVGARLQSLLAEKADRATLFGAVLEDLRLSSKPSIIVFEDVHWADEATLDLIKFLGRRIQHTAILLILTYRDDEVGANHPLTIVFGDLPARSLARVRLQPLSLTAVASLADSASHRREDVDQLYTTTGGNPFFVTEALASSAPGVPVSVRDAVLARAARLSPTARAALDLVSVVPRRTEQWIVNAVPAASLSGCEECVAAGMLRQEQDAFAFRHELARLAIESALPATRCRALHAAVLQAQLHAPAGHVDLARLVHHAAQAGDRERTLRFAPLAAQQAALQGAHREAASQYRTALRFAAGMPDAIRAELLEGLASECYLTGLMTDAAQAGEEALAIWRASDETRRIAHDLRWLSRVYWHLGRKADVDQYVEAAVQLLETLPPDEELALAYGYRGMFAMLGDEIAEGQAWGGRALDLAQRLHDDESMIHALNTVGMSRLYGGDPEGREQVEESLRLAHERGWHEHVARAYSNLTCYCVRFREYALAYHYADEGIAYCSERDIDLYALQMLSWRALAHLEQGQWDTASDEANAVLGSQFVTTVYKIEALVALGLLRIRRGDPGGDGLLDRARDLAAPTGELQRIAHTAAARAEAAWLRGNLALCATEARLGFDLAKAYANPWAHTQLAFWLWRAGDDPEPLPQGSTPFAAQIAGDWQAAAAEWERLGCPYERALALLDGDEPALLTALGIFEALGAHPAAEIARRTLRQSGARGLPRGPRPATRANPVGLTNRQLEILHLLLQGLRNTEIAERLYASPKTIEHHVSAILAKLGVRSRAEAAIAARELGISATRDTRPT